MKSLRGAGLVLDKPLADAEKTLRDSKRVVKLGQGTGIGYECTAWLIDENT